MDSTLHALGGLLLRAVPTFVLVILLNFYLRAVFFKPLEKMLRQRYEATEGSRKAAEEILERTSSRLAQYEAAIRAARAEVYEAQERLYKQLQEQEAAQVAAARESAGATIKEAKAQLAAELEQVTATLDQESDALADRIAESILRRSAA